MQIKGLASALGARVASAVDFPEAAALLRASHPALLITNVRLPNGDGRDLEKLARAMDVPVLLISTHPQDIGGLRLAHWCLYLRPGGGRFPGPYQVGGHQSGGTYRLAAFSRSMHSARSAVPGWKP